MNKHELVSPREFDDCLDHVYTLNEDTPTIKTFEKPNIAVDPDLIFGLDTRLFTELHEKVMIDGFVDGHHANEVDLVNLQSIQKDFVIERGTLGAALGQCPKEDVYRLKGFVCIEGDGLSILNFAFGRWDITPLKRELRDEERGLHLTAMVVRGTGRYWKGQLTNLFGLESVDIHYHES
jgi:G3E family GTPase